MIYGFDVGGTKIEFSVFDDKFNQLESLRVATPTQCFDSFIETLSTLVINTDRQYQTIGAVGIGLPGLVSADGTSLSANVNCLNGKNVQRALTKVLNRQIFIENDCRCFALSEANGGAGVGYQNVYGAVIGTGAAGGFTINGKLYSSRQGIAGEYGHIQLPAVLQQKHQLPIKPCACGLPSCFEAYIAGPGISFLHQHFHHESYSVPELVNLWRQKDSKATATFNCYLELLGACFANLVMSYDPDIIVLGGGISLVDEIIEQLPSAIKPFIFANFSVPLITRAKFGDASGVRGAALLTRATHV